MSNARNWVLVTGASTGIGRDCSLEWIKLGFSVYAVARSAQALEELQRHARELVGEGAGEIRPIAIDLTLPGSVQKVFEQTRDAQIVVNNAGVGLLGEFDALSWEQQSQMMDLNMRVLTELSYRFAQEFRQRGRGRFLQLASTAAFLPGPFMSVYYATKAYVLSFSLALAEELRGTGITVTAVCPGPTLTEFQKNAGMEATLLFKGPFVTSSSLVARTAVEACLAGKPLVVPGLLNQVSTWASRILPRPWLARIARQLMKPDESAATKS